MSITVPKYLCIAIFTPGRNDNVRMHRAPGGKDKKRGEVKRVFSERKKRLNHRADDEGIRLMCEPACIAADTVTVVLRGDDLRSYIKIESRNGRAHIHPRLELAQCIAAASCTVQRRHSRNHRSLDADLETHNMQS